MLLSQIIQHSLKSSPMCYIHTTDVYYQGLLACLLRRSHATNNSQWVETSVDLSSLPDLQQRLTNRDLFDNGSITYLINLSSHAKKIIEELTKTHNPNQSLIFLHQAASASKTTMPTSLARSPKTKERMAWIKDCLTVSQLTVSNQSIQCLDQATRDSFSTLCHQLFQLAVSNQPDLILSRLTKQHSVFSIANSLMSRNQSIKPIINWLEQANEDQWLHLYRLHCQNLRFLLQLLSAQQAGLSTAERVKQLKINPWKAKELQSSLGQWSIHAARSALEQCIKIEQVQKGLIKGHLKKQMLDMVYCALSR